MKELFGMQMRNDITHSGVLLWLLNVIQFDTNPLLALPHLCLRAWTVKWTKSSCITGNARFWQWRQKCGIKNKLSLVLLTWFRSSFFFFFNCLLQVWRLFRVLQCQNRWNVLWSARHTVKLHHLTTLANTGSSMQTEEVAVVRMSGCITRMR